MSYYNSQNNTGSITYELDNGANFRSFPFDPNGHIHLSGCNSGVHTRYGREITPADLDRMFNYSLTGIVGEGQGSISGSFGWVGSLQTIDPRKSYWLIATASLFPGGGGSTLSKVTGKITGSMIDPVTINQLNAGANAVANPYSVERHITGGLDPAATGIPNITKITAQGSAATYIEGSGWVGSLTKFTPGSGHWIIVSSGSNAWSNNNILPVFQGYPSLYPTSSLDPTEGEDSSYPLKYLSKEPFYHAYGYSDNGNYLMPGYNHDPSWYRPTQSGSTYFSTFGHWQSTEQMFCMFKTKVDGTGSLRDKDGNSLHNSVNSWRGPEFGWFGQLNGTGSTGQWAQHHHTAGDPYFYTGSAIYNNPESASVCMGAANWTGHPLGPTYVYSIPSGSVSGVDMQQNPNYIQMMTFFAPGVGLNPLPWPTNALPSANALGQGENTPTAGYGGKMLTKNAFKIYSPSTGVVPASLFCESGSGAWGEPHYIFLDSGQTGANEFVMFFNHLTGSSIGSDTYPFGSNSGSWSVDSDGYLVLSASYNSPAYYFGECYIQAKL